jgi:hypothetical protein
MWERTILRHGHGFKNSADFPDRIEQVLKQAIAVSLNETVEGEPEMSIAAENLPLPRRDVSRKKLPRRCRTAMVSKKTLPRRCPDATDYKLAAAAMVFKKIFRI